MGNMECTARNFRRISSKAPYTHIASTFGLLWTACAEIDKNYPLLKNSLLISVILIMVVLTLMLPEFSEKYRISKKMKELQNILNFVSTQVDHAEVSCLTVANEVYWFHCAMCDNSTETSANVQDLAICTSKVVPRTRSEPVQCEKKIGFFRKLFPHRNVSNKEIALMSYVYTDSFDRNVRKEIE